MVFVEEFLKASLLFDFYGELLTEKQRTVFEMYFLNDLSLGEIGQELSISRQAVRDQIKRTEKILFGYEEKLKLIERFDYQKMLVKKIKALAESIKEESGLEEKSILKIKEIMKISDEILD